MYNKLFTKILDSSIWLESDHTRIVWMTLIAAMDETGFVQFASVANLAHRAIVPLEAAEESVKKLEGPDANSSDPDNGGRRIERVPGGWMVLNAHKYRELVTRAISQEKTRARVAKHRAKLKAEDGGNGDVTLSNDSVTPSEADTETETTNRAEPEDIKKKEPKGTPSLEIQTEAQRFVVWFIDLLGKTGAPPVRLTPSNEKSWRESYEKLRRIDGKEKAEIKQVCEWARNDGFWKKNYYSPSKLRDRKEGISFYDLLLCKLKNKDTANGYHQKPNGRTFAQAGSYAGLTDK